LSFSEDVLKELRDRFSRGDLVGAKIRVSLPRRAGPAQIGEFCVFVQSRSDGKPCDSYYVREGMTITKLTSQAGRRGVQGFLCVDGGPLAELLGDSEGPAHEDWDTSEDRPDRYWKTWKGRVKFVRRAIDSFVELLSPRSNAPDFDLLSDFFSIEKAVAPQPSRGPNKNGQPNRPFDPIPMSPKWFRIDGRRGGFRLVPTKLLPVPPNASLRISVAYDLPSGNPLRNWSEFDFEFSNNSTIALSGEGVRATRQTKNIITLQIDHNDFWFEADGFDVHRDLFVRVDEIGTADDEEGDT
jgi:hypothetical protein